MPRLLRSQNFSIKPGRQTFKRDSARDLFNHRRCGNSKILGIQKKHVTKFNRKVLRSVFHLLNFTEYRGEKQTLKTTYRREKLVNTFGGTQDTKSALAHTNTTLLESCVVCARKKFGKRKNVSFCAKLCFYIFQRLIPQKVHKTSLCTFVHAIFNTISRTKRLLCEIVSFLNLF